MKNKVYIITSETFLNYDCNMMYEILNDTINEYIQPNHEIINIQLDRLSNGSSRFLIYVKNLDNKENK